MAGGWNSRIRQERQILALIFRDGGEKPRGDCGVCGEALWSRSEAEEVAARPFDLGMRVIDRETLGDQPGRRRLLLDRPANGDTADLLVIVEARRVLERMLADLGPGSPEPPGP